MARAASLDDILTRARAVSPQRPPVVVFDLDGTLFDNGPRTWQILVDFAESEGNADLRRALDALPRRNLPYLLGDVLKRCGMEDHGLLQRAVDFWRTRFFTDDFQRYDEPLAGAVSYARDLFAAGCTLVYLSGRDAPNMLLGVAGSLRQHGFPVGIPRTSIVLKHDFHDEDLAFKRDAIAFIDTMGVVVGSFDNEPANCNLFVERWPEASVFFVETSHAPNPPPLHSTVVRVPDFT
jgi:hypothetical protein